MSLNICQDLQPCLLNVATNSCFQNIKPSVKLHPRPCATAPATEEALHVQDIINNVDDARNHESSWNFLQALTNTSQGTKYACEDVEVYAHPQMKRTSSMLSIKSLEMCTENLGSETGSNFYESPLLSHPSEDTHAKEGSRLKKTNSTNNKLNYRKKSFPPPLTSMSGSKGVQVKPHREGGSLVLKAVTIDSYKSCFHAERVEGRLRLHFLNDYFLHYGADEQEEEMDFDNEDIKKDFDNVQNAEGEKIGKYSRPSRSSCKEGGQCRKMMQKWEPFRVAT